MAISYNIDPDLDVIVDEKPGNAFIALRKVSWGDNETGRIEIRKWFVNSEGDEIPGKGATFMTEQGPGKLAVALIDNGFGETGELLEALSKRDDFNDEIEYLANPSTKKSETYYDPKEFIGGY